MAQRRTLHLQCVGDISEGQFPVLRQKIGEVPCHHWQLRRDVRRERDDVRISLCRRLYPHFGRRLFNDHMDVDAACAKRTDPRAARMFGDPRGQLFLQYEGGLLQVKVRIDRPVQQ